MRPRGVADGQLVEIPVLLIFRTVGTQKARNTQEWKNWGKYKGVLSRKNRLGDLKYDAEGRKVPKILKPR